MLTIQTNTESGKRLLLGLLIACFTALMLAEVNGQEKTPTKPATEQTTTAPAETQKKATPPPTEPMTQSVYYDPKLALCQELEAWGWWWNYVGCYEVIYGGR